MKTSPLIEPILLKRSLPANYAPQQEALFAKAAEHTLYPVQHIQDRGVYVNQWGAVFRGLAVRPYSLRDTEQLSRYNAKTALKEILTKRPRYVPALLHFTEERSMGFFHWLCDALPRLWLLSPYWQSHPIVLPDWYDQPLVHQSLALLGLTCRIYPKQSTLYVRRLASCGMLGRSGNYNPQVMQALAAALSQACTTASPLPTVTALYISRRKAPRRYVLQEAALERELAALGIVSVCLEDYSFLQQVALLKHTRLLIGLHGGGLTNMLFMPQGAAVLELRFADDDHNNAYFSLADALAHRYYYTLGQGDGQHTHWANLDIDVAAVVTLVQRIKQDLGMP